MSRSTKRKPSEGGPYFSTGKPSCKKPQKGSKKGIKNKRWPHTGGPESY